MATAARRGSWDAGGVGGGGGLTFSQPSIGVGGGADAENDIWDDGAILKAFDDALSTHSRRPGGGTEAAKYSISAAQSATSNHKRAGKLNESSLGATGAGDRGIHDGQGYQQADSRSDTYSAKGSEEAAGRRPAGIPGPWEPVAVPKEGEREAPSVREVPPQEAAQRPDYATPGPYEYGSHHHHPYGAPGPCPPFGGATPNFGEGWDRYALPQPPMPPAPHPGAGVHTAAFQSLGGVHDDDLADLLLAWYYSGYYTGRFRAMQEYRSSRYRRPPYPPGAPSTPHGPPSSTSAQYGGADGWEWQQGWNGYPAHPSGVGQPSPGQADRPGVPVPPRATGPPEGRSGSIGSRRAGP